MAYKVQMDDWPTRIVEQVKSQGWDVDCIFRLPEHDEPGAPPSYFVHAHNSRGECGGDFVRDMGCGVGFSSPTRSMFWDFQWDTLSDAVHKGVDEVKLGAMVLDISELPRFIRELAEHSHEEEEDDNYGE